MIRRALTVSASDESHIRNQHFIMKKILTRIFSLVLAAATTLSVCAAPAPAAKKLKATGKSVDITALAKKPAAKAPSKNGARLMPKSRTAGASGRNLFRKASTVATKVPLKKGYQSGVSVPTIWGSVIYSDNWTSSSAYGLYTVPSNSSQSFEMIVNGANANYGGVLVDNIYYTCNYEVWGGLFAITTYSGYDVENDTQVFSSDYSYPTISMTLNPVDGTAYGIAVVEDMYALTKLDFSNEDFFEPLVAVNLASNQSPSSIVCDKNGQFYLFVNTSNSSSIEKTELYKLDANTGAVTLVGDTGEANTYITDATFDAKSNRLFWTVSPADETGWLCEVDTTTGEATRLYQFPYSEEVCGLVIPAPKAEDNAPAAVSNAKVTFEADQLSGIVNFTAPVTLFDGTAATGALTYHILANGEEVATGATTFGAEEAVNVTLTEPGLYNFVIYVSNQAGDGEKTTVKAVYVGKDTPEATKATLEYADGNMNLTWLPVTASINGGYINADAITYTVTRYEGAKDGVVVAENIKVTSFSEAIAEPESITAYYYTVVAETEGMVSAAAVSNTVTLGSIYPPYTFDFNDGSLEGFTIVNANGDNITWAAYNSAARISYNSALEMDDWLITPGIVLEKGKAYSVTASIYAQSSSFTEKVEVKYGSASTVAAMTHTLLEPTEITQTSNSPYLLEATVVPEEDGKIYIGVHGISDADEYYLYVDDIAVSAPISGTVPGAVTDLSVTPGADGAKTATISFTTPDKTLTGETLTSLTKVEVLRGTEVVKTFDAPAVATALTYTDNVTTSGNYTYTVIAYNADGAGAKAEASAFIGTTYPSAPATASVVETANPGEVTVSWDAVTTDENGTPISGVTYKVYLADGYSRVQVSEEITATSFTYQAVEAGEQDFVEYYVFAYCDGLESEGQYTDMIPVGTPYEGLSESFANGTLSYIFGMSTVNYGDVGLYTDESGISSQDGDNGFLVLSGQYLNDAASVFTGKISLEGMVNPGISLYTYNLGSEDAPDVNAVTVSVKEVDAEVWTDLYSNTVDQICAPGQWGKIIVPLDAFAGKTIQVQITGVVISYQYIPVDNLKVGSQISQDLCLAKISAPAKVKAGEAYMVDVTVTNEGTQESGAYTVELYAESELVGTKEGAALASGASAVTTFDMEMSALATEEVTYFAKVVYAADENETNNQSDNITVAPIVSNLPKVDDLAAAAQDAAVKLTWSEPNIEDAPADPITEDFEDADAFSAVYGDWIFVDVDKSAVGGFQNMEVPGVTVGSTTGSFWIWDQSQLGNQTFEAHSGTKYLFALFRYDDGTNDDWAISPSLSGDAQTVSFYARSYSASYPEKIEVYYSTGSTETTDFVKVEGVGGTVPDDWTLYTVDVPAGATRFAIRSCATGSFMLMVDDVTYIPAGASGDAEIVGYNVYRDGVKINDATVAETEYVDANVEAGKTYTYVVTTVYTKGESAASNVATVTLQNVGLDAINAAGVQINVVARNIVITGANGLDAAVYTVDGRTLYSGVAEAKTVVAARQGVYVVKAGKTVKKVIVK